MKASIIETRILVFHEDKELIPEDVESKLLVSLGESGKVLEYTQQAVSDDAIVCPECGSELYLTGTLHGKVSGMIDPVSGQLIPSPEMENQGESIIGDKKWTCSSDPEHDVSTLSHHFENILK